MKPEIILADYCEDCPHFNPEADAIFAVGNRAAITTVVRCIYRDQCRYAAEQTMKKCNNILKDELRNATAKNPAVKKSCDCWHPENYPPECWGTKERSQCTCGGDKNKCDFYGG